MEHIKLKIQELARSTPNVTNVAYGYKFVNNKQTNELCIMYGVEKKKSSSELHPDEILPTEITIGDKILKTDVYEVGKIELLACNPSCGEVAGPSSVDNRAFTRPLKGGLSITSTNNVSHVGTLGFIAVDTFTQALVGVTCNHVLIQDAFYTSERNLFGIVQNEFSPTDFVYQDGETGSIPPSNFNIGKVLRYIPISSTKFNYVDVAIFSVDRTDIDIEESFKTIGNSYSLPLPFASTSEINNLLATNPMLYSSGRTTGPKGGNSCPLRIFSLFSSSIASYNKQGVPTNCQFNDQIVFVKPENDPSLSTICSNPIYSGDSGSALIADFDGVRKIIGLVFAAGSVGGIVRYGYANRIDNIVTELGIEAWDGTDKNYVDINSIIYKTTINGSSNKTLVCGPNTYWQVGLTNNSNPC